MAAPHTYVSRKDEGDKVVVIERGDLVMVFNFHPSSSFQDYRIGCLLPGPYKVRRVEHAMQLRQPGLPASVSCSKLGICRPFRQRAAS